MSDRIRTVVSKAYGQINSNIIVSAEIIEQTLAALDNKAWASHSKKVS
ncbi:MAG: hypothetical protein U9Q07_04850 [Planctomycetota bacterium]|nr:hypothetical protein [Planctomycetota bacterium]